MNLHQKGVGLFGTSRKRGITLIQTLLFLMVIMILSMPLARIVASQRTHALRTHWGRCAEALAESALVLAAESADSATQETVLSARLSTGIAKAVLSRATDTEPTKARVEGIAASEDSIRAVRAYEARLEKASSESEWTVVSLVRLPPREELLPRKISLD
jgi:Tfp pilus assembly protein PilX